MQVFGALSVDETKAVFKKETINHAFIGPGISLNTRLEIIRTILTISDTTTIHMKDHSTGPEGALAFVRAILKGLDKLR